MVREARPYHEVLTEMSEQSNDGVVVRSVIAGLFEPKNNAKIKRAQKAMPFASGAPQQLKMDRVEDDLLDPE
jgi:hypothetical protein